MIPKDNTRVMTVDNSLFAAAVDRGRGRLVGREGRGLGRGLLVRAVGPGGEAGHGLGQRSLRRQGPQRGPGLAADLQGEWAAPQPCGWPVTEDMKNPEHFPLAVSEANYQGDGVAVVVADTRAHAVDAAEMEHGANIAANAVGPGILARVCAADGGKPLIHVSTDYVFDGAKGAPYVETDKPDPANMYGFAKWLGEKEARGWLSRLVVIRAAWLYGAHGRNFLKTMAAATAPRVVADRDDDAGIPGGFVNYITPAGFKRLNDELGQLWRVDRPKLVDTIAWAASNGDRSENGDYIYGKKRLREIDRRIRFLIRRLDVAEVVDPTDRKSVV